ncbi:MAG: HD domain-containing protein [Campylobacterales bacterium]|nr:HD domain-containing protein [Campylobacterales bacterium]
MSSKTTSIILKLEEALSSANTFEKKLAIIYNVVTFLMKHIFMQNDEKLPKHVLHACVVQIIGVMRMSNSVMHPLLLIMKKEYTTHHHSVNVAFMASLIGKEMHYTHAQLIELTYAALLHDIGKIRVENSILEKPASLSYDEFESIKHHTQYSHSILEHNGITNSIILNAVLFHHEKLDGSGYPKGLLKNDIPPFAQIIGVCDIFDALTTKRTFRESHTSYEALMIIKQEMAHQLDYHLVDILIRMLH